MTTKGLGSWWLLELDFVIPPQRNEVRNEDRESLNWTFSVNLR